MIYKITVSWYSVMSNCSVSVLEDKNTPKAAFDRGKELISNISGQEYDPNVHGIQVEQQGSP